MITPAAGSSVTIFADFMSQMETSIWTTICPPDAVQQASAWHVDSIGCLLQRFAGQQDNELLAVKAWEP